MALLNFFLPPVGYLLIAQWKKGLSALVAAFVVVVVTLGYGLPIFALVAALDGYKQAALLQRGLPIGQWTWFGKALAPATPAPLA